MYCRACFSPNPKSYCFAYDALYCNQKCANAHFEIHHAECVGSLGDKWLKRRSTKKKEYTFKASQSCFKSTTELIVDSEMKVCVYDMQNITSRVRDHVEQLIFAHVFSPRGCMAIDYQFIVETLENPNLRYAAFINVTLNTPTSMEFPIALVLLSEFGKNTIQIDLLCTYQFVDLEKQADALNALLNQFGLEYESDARFLRMDKRDEFDSQLINIQNMRVKTGLGVIMVCKIYTFLLERGVKQMVLDAATPTLIAYYTRLGFSLNPEKTCGQQPKKKDLIAFKTFLQKKDIQGLTRYLLKQGSKYKAPDGGWKMVVCDMEVGMEKACIWAQQFLEKGLPNLEIDSYQFETPNVSWWRKMLLGLF